MRNETGFFIGFADRKFSLPVEISGTSDPDLKHISPTSDPGNTCASCVSDLVQIRKGSERFPALAKHC